MGSIRRLDTKRINWYGSITTRPGTGEPEIFARVESLEHRLLEEHILQVNAAIKLFAVFGSGDYPGGYSTLVHASTFMRLRPVAHPRDILSIRHRVDIAKVTVRPGRISVIGTLELEVEYLSPVSLDGRVTDFLTGQPVGGARVILLEMENGRAVRETTTAADGTYAFADCDAGTYRVRVEAEGYEPQEEIAVLMLRDTVNFVLYRRREEEKMPR
ncbi:carboxypeptidase-like regulatory domain-containing protein [Desulfovirgula thermocuniculi]|uniref:carboxypeptidase-like regulatory domain-containing protein n=1 Tax=Desulfovirgula thermocuniculi TaxID=348842 RepID=UPI0003FBD7AF|nr:carboxypeptidase-like regulatory domain-containing protein [Desulfovirgula thermocuniculi]